MCIYHQTFDFIYSKRSGAGNAKFCTDKEAEHFFARGRNTVGVNIARFKKSG